VTSQRLLRFSPSTDCSRTGASCPDTDPPTAQDHKRVAVVQHRVWDSRGPLDAISFGSEHSAGTLRALLTREPRRLGLLAGKWAALSVFIAATLLLAVVLSSVVALLLAPGRDISTADWFSGSGLATAAGDYTNAVVSALLYGTIGAVVATLVRSGPIALGLGLAWLGPLEHLISDGWAGGKRWFPGLTFEAVAAGGNDATSYGRALSVGLLFAVVAGAVGAVTFARRDVST